MTATLRDHRRRKLGWTPYAWLVYLLFFIAHPALNDGTWREWAWTLGAVAAFLPLYLAGFQSGGRRLLVIAWTIHVLGVLAVAGNPAASCFFVYAAAFLGFTGPSRSAFRWLAVMLAVIAVEAVLLSWPPWVWLPGLVISAVIGATNIHFAEMHRKDAHLRVAQQAVEEMARIAERERIGRDLHDLLGHTLSVIVLKSDLAQKLLHRDLERARHEIAEVEKIARDGLAEVRQAITGYRSSGLEAEIEHVREALCTAGIDATIEKSSVALAPAQETALTLALREAATNVIRHARASTCHIRFYAKDGSILMEVEDNGCGGEAPFGHGLTGMRERIQALGGVLRRESDGGTRLQIRLPVVS